MAEAWADLTAASWASRPFTSSFSTSSALQYINIEELLGSKGYIKKWRNPLVYGPPARNHWGPLTRRPSSNTASLRGGTPSSPLSPPPSRLFCNLCWLTVIWSGAPSDTLAEDHRWELIWPHCAPPRLLHAIAQRAPPPPPPPQLHCSFVLCLFIISLSGVYTNIY